MSQKRTYLFLLGIISAAALVRIYAALHWQGLLFDEIASVEVALRPLNEMWTYLRYEMHPPLHFVYLHFWIKFFGQSDATLRLSSVLTGLGAVGAMYLLGKEAYKSRRAGLYAAMLTSFAAATAFHSIFVRMYSLLFFLACLSFYFFLRATQVLNTTTNQQKNTLNWSLFSFFTLLALYTHLTALAIPLVQLLFLLYLRYKKQITAAVFKKFFIAAGIALLLYLPWFVNFFFGRLLTLGSRAWFIYSEPLELFFLTLPTYFLTGQTTTHYLPIVAFLLIFILILVGLFKIRRYKSFWLTSFWPNPANIISLLIFLVPMIILFSLSLHSWRFYTLSIIGFFLLLCAGLLKLNNRSAFMAIVIFLTIVLSPLVNLFFLAPVGWPQIGEFIARHERPGDRIIVAYPTDLLAVKYYYRGLSPIEPFAEPGISQQYTDDLDFVMQENSRVYASEKTIKNFAGLVGSSPRLFFVFDGKILGTTYSIFINWFLEHGWQKIASSSKNSRFNQAQAWLLEK